MESSGKAGPLSEAEVNPQPALTSVLIADLPTHASHPPLTILPPACSDATPVILRLES